ncbi:unnamed protein product [Durusdinium trenchii]|uniref:Phosphoribosyltransferase domain-containing protein n=1 Tax=Durusdinium trenchii TaxID=1381693 RepID=A0ABP0L5Y7_9DINO
MKFRSVLGLHMSMDPVLLDACGDVLAAQFAGVTKVLTGAPVQGLSVAYVVARHCEVPMIFARTGVPLTMKGQRILSAQAPTGTFNVSAEFFGPSDRVLIVDDFLASGQTAKALQQICHPTRHGSWLVSMLTCKLNASIFPPLGLAPSQT